MLYLHTSMLNLTITSHIDARITFWLSRTHYYHKMSRSHEHITTTKCNKLHKCCICTHLCWISRSHHTLTHASHVDCHEHITTTKCHELHKCCICTYLRWISRSHHTLTNTWHVDCHEHIDPLKCHEHITFWLSPTYICTHVYWIITNSPFYTSETLPLYHLYISHELYHSVRHELYHSIMYR